MSTSQRPWQLEYLDDELVPSDNSVSQQASESYDRSAALQATSSATALGSIISNQALNISSTEQAPSQPSTSKAARAPVSIKPFQSTGRVGWAKLNKLVDVLGKSTAVCVPLKEIVGDFIGLIDVYEASTPKFSLPFFSIDACGHRGRETAARNTRRCEMSLNIYLKI